MVEFKRDHREQSQVQISWGKMQWLRKSEADILIFQYITDNSSEKQNIVLCTYSKEEKQQQVWNMTEKIWITDKKILSIGRDRWKRSPGKVMVYPLTKVSQSRWSKSLSGMPQSRQMHKTSLLVLFPRVQLCYVSPTELECYLARIWMWSFKIWNFAWSSHSLELLRSNSSLKYRWDSGKSIKLLYSWVW